MKKLFPLQNAALIAVVLIATAVTAISSQLFAVLYTDLSITKRAPASILPGYMLRYNITVRNAGENSAEKVTIRDGLPSYVSFSAANNPGWTLTGTTATLEVGKLLPKQTTTVSLYVGISNKTPCNRSLTNRANVSASTEDHAPANNRTTHVVTVTCPPPPPSADLSITKTGSTLILRGNTLQYQIAVRNPGPNNASGTTVLDSLPSYVSFNAANNPGWTLTGTAATFNVGTLQANTTRYLPLQVTVPGTTPCNTTITNSANVSATEPTDPKLGNNLATHKVLVTCP